VVVVVDEEILLFYVILFCDKCWENKVDDELGFAMIMYFYYHSRTGVERALSLVSIILLVTVRD